MGYNGRPIVVSKRAPRRGGLRPCQGVLEMPSDLVTEKIESKERQEPDDSAMRYPTEFLVALLD